MTGCVFQTEYGPARVLGPWHVLSQYVEIEYLETGCRSVRVAEHVRLALGR